MAKRDHINSPLFSKLCMLPLILWGWGSTFLAIVTSSIYVYMYIFHLMSVPLTNGDLVCQDMMVWKPGKLQRSSKVQNRRASFDVELYLTVHKSFVSTYFIKYYSLWLHVSSQLSLLGDYLIIRKYNEVNHRDRAQLIHINSDKTWHNDFCLVSRPSYLDLICTFSLFCIGYYF